MSPKLDTHAGSRLRNFTAYSDRQLLVLGARRSPPVTSPNSNSERGIAVWTSVGFRELSSSDFVRAACQLGADVVVGLGDIVHGSTMGRRRRDRMFSRSERWMQELMNGVNAETQYEGQTRQPAVFAPVLPIEVEQQRWYLELLGDDLRGVIAGLAVYDRDTATELPESLSELPRLSLTEAKTPIQLLQEVGRGIDLLTAPFVGNATDAGIALDMCFPPGGQGERKPLGIDMWAAEHALSKERLSEACACYACTKYSRAYVRHLLTAKEMLAWVLLQIHNLQMMDRFFTGVRASLGNGSFSRDKSAFEASYEAEMPVSTGAGPRVRGYQIKSEGPHEAKKNTPAFVIPANGTPTGGDGGGSPA